MAGNYNTETKGVEKRHDLGEGVSGPDSSGSPQQGRNDRSEDYKRIAG